jgi:DNA polymerase-3 subunit epsilon
MTENTTADLFPSHPDNPPLDDVKFAVLDVETTGLEHEDRVLEVACLVTQGSTVRDTYDTLINPDRPIPRETVSIHGIREEDVLEAPRFGEIFPKLETLLTGAVLVAHNAPYDVSFLSRECTPLGLKLPSMRVLDTLTLARNLLRVEHYSLEHLAEKFALQHRPAHRALADVMTTHELLWKLIDVPADRPRTLEDLLRLLIPPEVSWDDAQEDGVIPPPLLPLKEGLEAKEALRILYAGRSGEETLQDVIPERLERSGGHIYLRARLTGEREVRVFRLDRIAAVHPTEPRE